MTGMSVKIRNAGIFDLPLLMEWRMRVLEEVFSDYENVDWDVIRSQNIEYYKKHLKSETHTPCFAYEENGSVIGCGGICYQTEMPSPDNLTGTCGYLMNIYTVPEVRGSGVGKKIIEYLIADAKIRKTGKIYLESSDVAKALYESIGFQSMRDYYKL